MTCYNSELPIGPPGPTGPQGPQGEPGAALGYKVYTALLTQSGLIAPTIVELENTLSGTPSFEYIGVGRYTINLTGEFITNKTCIFIGPLYNGLVEGYSVISPNTTVSSIEFITINNAGDFSDEMLFNTAIEIRVYP